jgi:muramoyltetrapeptide carboxypeptidase
MPALLKPGDTVALIAPSSPLADPKDLPACIEGVKRLGLEPKEYPTLRLAEDFMAGSAKQRAKDLTKAFHDKSCKGILCMRGGYSAGHLMPMIDWKDLGKTGKLFAGFSDITTILTGLSCQGNLAALHSITMSYNVKKSPETDTSFEALKRFLFEPWRGISYRDICGKDLKPQTIRRGKAKGRIIGGNASVFAGLIGTPVIPRRGPLLLFLEDVGERPYKLDRYMTQIIQSGFMDQVVGVILGQFNDCEPKAPDTGSAVEVLGRLLAPLKIPVLAGVPIGHDRPSYPLPIGVQAELDATRGDITLL